MNLNNPKVEEDSSNPEFSNLDRMTTEELKVAKSYLENVSVESFSYCKSVYEIKQQADDVIKLCNKIDLTIRRREGGMQ